MPNSDNLIKHMSLKEAGVASRKQPPFSIGHKVILYVVLSTYFLCIFIWDSPPGPLKTILIPFISPLIEATSTGQGWSVFSPEVREQNYHETALITFQDGLQKLYEFPRMQKLDYGQRFRSEKFRKMFFDCMPWPAFQQFLPDFAKFVTDANEWPGNSPRTVCLIHHSCKTPQPEQGPWINRSDLPEHTHMLTYYFYRPR
jgi:hypothetical protein